MQGCPLSTMLFVIVVEALHALMEEGNLKRLLKRFSVEHSSLEVSHLHFADDVIFCNASLNEVGNLNSILCWFELI